jgi:hypothetical protein
MPDGPLEDALDELYGVEPSEFVSVRKRLSAALREAGDKAGTKLLQGARRPSTSAWALNQLARRVPEIVQSLLDASSALYAAQTRGSNKPEALRDAIRAHREALDAATDAATSVLGERGNDAFRGEIVSTLRAVSSDEEIERQLRAGRLIREASSSGFPDAAGLTLVPDLPASKSGAKPKVARRATNRREPTEAAANAAETAQAEREREARQRAELVARESARKDAETADAVADRAHARVEELEGELEVARRELTEARARSRKARSTLRDLR